MADAPPWTLRFTHPRIEQVDWAIAAPDRLGAVSNESGSTQAWAWDLRSAPDGKPLAVAWAPRRRTLTPDGSGVVWWYDESVTSEGAGWSPFDGGEARPLFRRVQTDG